MSECVVRMEMPKNNCEMAVEIKDVGDWCPIAARVCDYYSTKKMPDWCPIICQLPEGHGRLVESDQVAKMIDRWIGYLDEDMIYRIKFALNRDVPTIVPAERSDNDFDRR